MTEDIYRARQAVIKEAERLKPTATKNAYNPKMEEFKSWCRGRFAGEQSPETVSEDKLLIFLQECVVDRPRKRKRSSEAENQVVGSATVLQYVNAVVHLWNQQKAEGSNNLANPRGTMVKQLLKNEDKKTHKRKKANYEDRGKGTVREGYTDKDKHRLMGYFWQQTSRSVEAGIRNKVMFNACEAWTTRGNEVRLMELPDLFLYPFEHERGNNKHAVAFSLRQSKKNQFGLVEYGGALRHREVEFCLQGNLAQWLFWRYHIHGEQFPSFERSEDWYSVKVFPKDLSSSSKEMNYATQYEGLKKAFIACGVASTKVTHSGRGQSVKEMEKRGVSKADSDKSGRWTRDAAGGVYRCDLSLPALRASAGFDPNVRNSCVKRGMIPVPGLLTDQIFPQATEALKVEREKENSNIAAVGFLEMLIHLRAVLIQDSVLLQSKYPKNAFFKHKFFKSETFKLFGQRMMKQMEEMADPEVTDLQQVIPELTTFIGNGHSSILNEMAKTKAEIKEHVDARLRNLDNRLSRPPPPPRFKATTTIVQLHDEEESEDGNEETKRSSFSSTVQSSAWRFRRNGKTTAQVGRPRSLEDKDIDYRMNRSVNTVTELWKEWRDGLDGGPSVAQLKNKYRGKWPKSSGEQKFFSRRFAIVKKIREYMEAHRASPEDAVAYYEGVRGSASIDKLSKMLTQNSTRQRNPRASNAPTTLTTNLTATTRLTPPEPSPEPTEQASNLCRICGDVVNSERVCTVCKAPVHHFCSNDLLGEQADRLGLSQALCSEECKKAFF